MIYSTYHKKNTNEDPKTSVVFENLMLLPDGAFWEILKTAASNKGILPDEAGLLLDRFEFWPKWDPGSKYKSGNSSYVEPDVFFRFENVDVIVEAKYSDNTGQYRGEWEREFKAYLNEYEDENKDVVLLAVGGNPSFEREAVMAVGERKCPIVKYSWVNLLNAVLAYEQSYLPVVYDEQQSSVKRIIRNIETGFRNIGIRKYKKKVELKGLSNLYALGMVFQAVIRRETDFASYSYGKEDVNRYHYGFMFKLTPHDTSKEPIWLSIALWINDQETICIEARKGENWAENLCNMIDEKKPFSSKYSNVPYIDEGRYYFEASELFYQEFNEAETFDGQVELVSKLVDEVCMYYLA